MALIAVATAWQDIRAAFSFLTILPLRAPEGRAPGFAFAWFPFVGVVVGGLAALVSLLPVQAPLRAFLVLAVWVGVTGALHLDGLADACDGLLSTTSAERRLEIMKDSRAGAWAVVGVGLLLLGKFAAIQGVGAAVLVAATVGGRWAMVLAAAWFPYARVSGVGSYFRQGLSQIQVAVATVTALAVIGVAAFFDWRALFALTAPLVAWGLGRWAAARLGGGLTGDVYGATCEVTELLIVTGAALWAAG